MTGRGVFTGPDAAAQFSALHALLETGGAEILTVPEYGPLRAILTELILLRGSMRMVEYTFAFRESPMESASSPCREQTTMLQEGETLWHLAARLAIPIEQLLTLNPKIPEPWSAKAGTEAVSYTHLDVYKRQPVLSKCGPPPFVLNSAFPVLF